MDWLVWRERRRRRTWCGARALPWPQASEPRDAAATALHQEYLKALHAADQFVWARLRRPLPTDRPEPATSVR